MSGRGLFGFGRMRREALQEFFKWTPTSSRSLTTVLLGVPQIHDGAGSGSGGAFGHTCASAPVMLSQGGRLSSHCPVMIKTSLYLHATYSSPLCTGRRRRFERGSRQMSFLQDTASRPSCVSTHVPFESWQLQTRIMGG